MASSLFQPILGEVKTPTFIAPPVVNRAASTLVEGVASMVPAGIEAYKESQLGKIMPEIDEAITQYEESHQALQQTDAEIGAQRAAADSIWDRYGKQDVSDPEGMASSLNAIEANLAKYVAARKQGKISEQALLGRINQITREAVMKNPWLEKELYAKAQGYLKMSGISDVLDYRMDLAKSEKDSADKTYNFFRQAVKDAGLPVYPNEPLESMVNRYDVHAREAYMVTKAEQVRKGQQVLTEIMARDAIQSGNAFNFHYADFGEFTNRYIQELAANPSAEGFANVVARMEMEAQQRVMQWNSAVRPALGQAPEATDFLNRIEGDYKQTLATLTKLGSAKEAAEFLKNKFEVLDYAQKNNLYSRYDVNSINFATTNISNLGITLRQLFGEAGAPTIQQLFTDMLHLTNPEDAGRKAVESTISSGGASNLFKGLIGVPEPSKNQVDASVFVLKAVNEKFANPETGVSKLQKQITAQSMLADIARGQAKLPPAFSNDPQFSTEVRNLVDYSMDNTVKDLEYFVSKTLEKNPLLTLEVDLLPSGSFVINSNDSAVARKFNEKFSVQINNALDSLAKANGISREQAAQEFYQKYFGKYVQQPKAEPLEPAMSDLNRGVDTQVPTTPEKLNSVNPSESEGYSMQQETPSTQPIAPPTIDPQTEIEAIANTFIKLKEQYKKGQISREEWEMKVDYLNERRKTLLPNGRLFGDGVEEEKVETKPDVKSEANVLEKLLAELNKPRSVVRDDSGRIVGLS